jgi:hypothetical protein
MVGQKMQKPNVGKRKKQRQCLIVSPESIRRTLAFLAFHDDEMARMSLDFPLEETKSSKGKGKTKK